MRSGDVEMGRQLMNGIIGKSASLEISVFHSETRAFGPQVFQEISTTKDKLPAT